jgi:hypothetical protein
MTSNGTTVRGVEERAACVAWRVVDDMMSVRMNGLLFGGHDATPWCGESGCCIR